MPAATAVARPRQATPARYPLEIQNVGEDTYIVMSRGHHDPHEFMRVVRELGYDWPLGMPEHRWAKAVPSRDPSMRCSYVFVDQATRGAFPATYAWVAYGEDRYEARAAANKRAGEAQGDLQ